MRYRRSLRHRVVLAFALFGGAVSLMLAFGLYVSTMDLEKRLVDEALAADLDDYLAQLRDDPHSPPPASSRLRVYVRAADERGGDIPTGVRGLGPGRYQMVLGDLPYRVQVAERDGKRFYFLFNESQLVRRRHYVLGYLAGGVLVMVVMSAAGALWLAGGVISPVTELAQRVRGLGPEGSSRPLVEDFPGDEVGELATACDRYLERLRGFMDRERAFTADVSHELRTPLAVINGAVEVLHADDNLCERTRNRISRIERAAQEMSEIISALLVLAREDAAGAPPAAPCAVEALLHEAVDKHRYLLAGKPVEVALAVDASVSLPVAPTLLSIVLGNLIRNAFSYTDQGLIRVRLTGKGVTVQDTGLGMRQEDLVRAFQRYHRGVNRLGEGIGLSLVKRICDRNGWDIAIRSEEGRGTAVRLVFHQTDTRGPAPSGRAVPPAATLTKNLRNDYTSLTSLPLT
jgi:signal transduction histidine kinase